MYHFAAMNGPASGPARLRAWERDVINRQRNIVFPDTVLNEGRFYRNIASGKAIFTRGQKISLLLLFLYIFTIVTIFIALAAIDLATSEKPAPGESLLSITFPLLWPAFLWTFLARKGLFPPIRQKKRRRGYRHSIGKGR
jgi:hypothetical protein